MRVLSCYVARSGGAIPPKGSVSEFDEQAARGDLPGFRDTGPIMRPTVTYGGGNPGGALKRGGLPSPGAIVVAKTGTREYRRCRITSSPPTFNREIKDYYYKCFCSRKISRGRLISGPHTAFEGYIHIRRWESRFHGWEED
jgi:ribosomal protein S14